MSVQEVVLTEPAAGELERLRGEIEELDGRILELVAERVALARRIGEAKLRLGVLFTDPAQEAAVVCRAAERARRAAVPEESVRGIFWGLVELCRRVQLEAR